MRPAGRLGGDPRVRRRGGFEDAGQIPRRHPGHDTAAARNGLPRPARQGPDPAAGSKTAIEGDEIEQADAAAAQRDGEARPAVVGLVEIFDPGLFQPGGEAGGTDPVEDRDGGHVQGLLERRLDRHLAGEENRDTGLRRRF